MLRLCSQRSKTLNSRRCKNFNICTKVRTKLAPKLDHQSHISSVLSAPSCSYSKQDFKMHLKWLSHTHSLSLFRVCLNPVTQLLKLYLKWERYLKIYLLIMRSLSHSRSVYLDGPLSHFPVCYHLVVITTLLRIYRLLLRNVKFCSLLKA